MLFKVCLGLGVALLNTTLKNCSFAGGASLAEDYKGYIV